MTFPQKVVKFLEQPNFMVISEFNPDETIHSTIVWYEFNADDGTITFSTTADRVKYRNLSNDPRCTVVIIDPDDMYKYVQMQGEITNSTREGGHDFLDELTKKYMGKDTYPYDPERKEDRVTYTITPDDFFTVGFD